MKARRNLFLGTLVVIALSHSAQADTYNWNGLTTGAATGASDTWDTVTANWSGFATTWPAATTTNDDAVFAGAGGTVTIIAGGITTNSLTFDSDGYILSGGALALDGTTPTITTADATLTEISSVISGSAGLTKAGTGDLKLSGINNYTGVTNINTGTLIAGNGAALGSNVDGTTVAANGTLDVGGQNLGTEVITISGAGPAGDGAIINSGAQQTNALGRIVLAGNATIGGGVRWDLRNSTPTLNMAGFTLTKTGGNYLGLIGTAVSNPGNIAVDSGELSISTGTNLGGSSSNQMTVNSGGVLSVYQSSSPHAWSLNLNDGSTLRGENGTSTQNIWAGPVSVAGEVTLRAESGYNLTISGNITGTANLTKTGAGTAYLSGTNNITSTALTITGGALQVNNASGLTSATTITTSGFDNASLVLGNSLVAGSGKTITVAGNGVGAAFGALSSSLNNTGTAEWQGSVTIGAATGARIGTQAGNLLISGTIGETNAGSELIFRNNVATSSVILTGSNTYTGSPLIASGRVQVATIGNTGVNSPLGQNGTIRLGLTNVNGGTLLYTGTAETTDKVIDLSSTTGAVAIDQSGTGLLKFTANFTATGAGPKTLTLQGDTAGTGEIAGAVVNGASGSTVLSSNFAANATTITLASVEGIAVGADISGTGIAASTTVSAINPSTRVVTLSTPATGAGTANQTVTVTGVINPNSLAKSGTNTWVLSGTNSYTGGTTVNSGTLKLDFAVNDTSKLSDTTSPLTLAGGTLELAGGSHLEAVTSTTLAANTASTVTRSSGSAVLQMNGITRNSGATINFAQSGIATTETLNNAGGILGAWALVGGTDWAVNSTNAADGPITALSSYTLTSTALNAAGSYAAANISVDSNQAPDGLITPNSLRFNGPAANTLTLQGANSIASGGILVTTGTGTNTSTITGGTLTGPVSGDLVIQQNNPTGNLEIASQIINNTATSVVKTGVGSVTLSGANTYTGLTSIIGGTLKAGSISAFTNKGGLSMTGTSVFDLNGFNATFTTLASAATNVITNSSSGTGASNATAVGTPAGAGVYVDAVTFSTQGQSIAAQVTDGTVRKTQLAIYNSASGTNLAGITNTANSFSGGLVLLNTTNGTRLRINSAITGTPFGTGPIIIGQAATDKAQILLDSTAANTLANDVFINTAVGTDAPGAFRLDTAGHTLSGKITANLAAARFTTGTGKTASASVTGQVTGSNGLTLEAGPATSVLTVTLNNGTANPNNYLGNTIINPAAATGRSSTLKLGAANQIPSGIGAGDVAITTVGTGVGTLDLNGFNQQINGLSGTGTVDGNVAGTAGSNTLTVGDEDATGAANTFSGTIKNTLGTLALTKIGSGKLTLSGTNTYAGPTLISTGTLEIGAGGTTGSLSPSSSITNDGTLTFNRSNAIAQGTDFASVISGTGAVTKLGAGILTLSGVNTFTGNVSLNGSGNGGIKITNSSSLGGDGLATKTVNLQVGTNGVAELDMDPGAEGSITLSNKINFTVSSNSTTGSGIVSRTGTNEIQGKITMRDGLSATAISSSAGSTLTLSGVISASATTRTLNLGGDSVNANTISGNMDASGGFDNFSVAKNNAGTWILAGTNTYTGNTTVNAGTLTLTGQLRFVPTTTGTTNAVTGAGTFNANGTFLLDLSGANTTAGNSWLLVDVSALTESFGGAFTVNSTLGAFSETSPGVWQKTDSGKIWTFTESTGTLAVANASGDDYATWSGPSGYNLTQGPAGDDDGDSLTNFEEYAFGLDPTSGSSVNPISQPLNKTSGTFKYTRRATPATTGVNYTYESSTTLSGAWDPVTPVSAVSNNATPVEEITVTIPGAPLTDPKFFIRVKAVKP